LAETDLAAQPKFQVMLRKGTCVIVVLAALSVAGCGSGSGNGGSGGSAPSSVDIKLAPQNGSGESGSATLTAEGDKTKVVISLESMSANPVSQPQPAHIHTGSCAKLDPTPKYGLTDVADGKSTTVVNAKLGDLRNGAFAINVHKSAAAINTYVACGDIGAASATDTGTTGSGCG
jgi:hypothetical protein